MASQDLTIRYLGDSSDLEKTQKRVSQSINATSQQAKQSADKIEASFQKTSKALDKTADASGDTERALLGVADVLEVVGLNSAAAGTRIAADLGGGLEGIIKGGAGVKGALGAVATAASVVAVAVASGATAYLLYANALGESRAEVDAIHRSLEALDRQLGIDNKGLAEANKSWDRFTEAAKKVQTELDIVNGVQTALQAQGEAQVENLKEQASEGILTAGKLAAAAEQRIEANKRLIKSGQLTLKEEIAARQEIDASKVALADANALLEERRAALDKAVAGAQQLTEYNTALADSEEFLSDRTRERAEAEKMAREETSALNAVEAIRVQAIAATLEGEDAILFARDQQLAKLDEYAAKLGEVSEIEQARAAVQQQAAFQILDGWTATTDQIAADTASLTDELASNLGDLSEAFDDLVAEVTEESGGKLKQFWGEFGDDVMSMSADLSGSLNSLFDTVTGYMVGIASESKQALLSLGEDVDEEERKAAMQKFQREKQAALDSFYLTQNAALATAAINGALSITDIWSENAGNPLYASILTGLSVAAIGAQVAAILAAPPPSFHTGGIVGRNLESSEVPAILRAGEGVLSRQGLAAIGGEQALEQANRGQPSGGMGGMTIAFPTTSGFAERVYVTATGTTGRGRRATRQLRGSGRTSHYNRRG
jgi:hypothetical protein